MKSRSPKRKNQMKVRGRGRHEFPPNRSLYIFLNSPDVGDITRAGNKMEMAIDGGSWGILLKSKDSGTAGKLMGAVLHCSS